MMKKLVFSSCLVFALFYGDCFSMNVHNIEDFDSDSSSRSLTSSSSSEEWIVDHKELINSACYEKRSFDELIDEISKYSSVAEDRRILYGEIENRWNERNIFGATILDGGNIICCRVQRFDF